MPTSKPEIITPVAKKILELQPKTILDIGVGHGKWGMLAREYTDIWYWRHYKEEWVTVIDGLEIFEKYRNPIWDYAYNKVTIGDATDVPVDHELVIMIDVIEHIEKNSALEMLKKFNGAIISYTNSPQGSVRGNDHEAHISEWELTDFPPHELLYEDDITKVIYIMPRT